MLARFNLPTMTAAEYMTVKAGMLHAQWFAWREAQASYSRSYRATAISDAYNLRALMMEAYEENGW